jgi:delta 1-pyrroline-5-carboxylate dehydrogenase
MWPKSTGKGTSEYVDGAVTKLDRSAFERELREFVGKELASELSQTHVQVLFDISEDHCRELGAVYSVKNEKLIQDWSHRKKLIKTINAKLAALRDSLKKSVENPKWPTTALFAESVHDKLVQLQKDLDDEIAGVKQHQRASAIMLRALSLKTLRDGYVAELEHYIGQIVLPRSAKKEQHFVIAGVMAAARIDLPPIFSPGIMRLSPGLGFRTWSL